MLRFDGPGYPNPTLRFLGMESLYALVLAVLLALPLIVQFRPLITDPEKFRKIFEFRLMASRREEESSDPVIVMHHPELSTAASPKFISRSNATPASPKPASSSPTLDRDAIPRTRRTVTPAKRSSSFVAISSGLPVVDVTYAYDFFRHKLLKSTLRKRYGDNYPPGRVVFNSLQLNWLHSSKDLSKSGASVTGLFDYLVESDGVASAGANFTRRPEVAYLHPLDHFVAKPAVRAMTEERATETADDEGESDAIREAEEDFQPSKGKARQVPPKGRADASSVSHGRKALGTSALRNSAADFKPMTSTTSSVRGSVL